MADLNNFSRPDNSTTEQDMIDTVRGNHVRAITLNAASAANTPSGALRLDSPGAAERTLTQYNGVTYSNFRLSVPGGFRSNSYESSVTGANINFTANQVAFNYEAGAFDVYDRVLKQRSFNLGGLLRWAINQDRLSVWASRANEPDAGFTTALNGGSSSVAAVEYNTLQNELGFTSSVNYRRINTDGSSGEVTFLSPPGARNADRLYLATRLSTSAVNQTRLIFDNLSDDGQSCIQARNLRAPNQARGQLSAGLQQDFPANSTATVSFSTSSNFDGLTAPTSNTLMAARPMRVLATFSAEHLVLTGTPRPPLIRWNVNGAVVRSTFPAYAAGAASNVNGLETSVVLEMNALDTLRVDVTMSGGAGTGTISLFGRQLSVTQIS